MTLITDRRAAALVDLHRDPADGATLTVSPGRCLEVRMRRSIGGGEWRVVERPPFLVPLSESGSGALFLAFSPGGAAAAVLRLTRHRPGNPGPVEERTVTVLVSD